jgi:hypothetical protein
LKGNCKNETTTDMETETKTGKKFKTEMGIESNMENEKAN